MLAYSKYNLANYFKQKFRFSRFLVKLQLLFTFTNCPADLYFNADFDHLTSKLIQQAKVNQPIETLIKESDAVNAFSISANSTQPLICFHDSLIVDLENVEEFAWVFWHELGHITKQHSALGGRMWNTLRELYKYNIISIFIPVIQPIMTLILSQGLKNYLQSSRMHEHQADDVASKLFLQNNYDLQKGLGWLKRMATQEEELRLLNTTQVQYMLTHPFSIVRIESFKQNKPSSATQVQSLPQDVIITFQFLQSMTKARIMPTEMEKHFRSLPVLSPADKYGLAWTYYFNNKLDLALQLANSLVEVYPLVAVLQSAIYHKKHDYATASSLLRSIYKTYPLPSILVEIALLSMEHVSYIRNSSSPQNLPAIGEPVKPFKGSFAYSNELKLEGLWKVAYADLCKLYYSQSFTARNVGLSLLVNYYGLRKEIGSMNLLLAEHCIYLNSITDNQYKPRFIKLAKDYIARARKHQLTKQELLKAEDILALIPLIKKEV